MLNDVEVLVLRHVRRILKKLGVPRIERVRMDAVGMVFIAMTASTVRLVELHSGREIVIVSGGRVPDFWSSPINGDIERRHTDRGFY